MAVLPTSCSNATRNRVRVPPVYGPHFCKEDLLLKTQNLSHLSNNLVPRERGRQRMAKLAYAVDELAHH